MKTLTDLFLARDLAELRINTALKEFVSTSNACLGDGVRYENLSFTEPVLMHNVVFGKTVGLVLTNAFKITVN